MGPTMSERRWAGWRGLYAVTPELDDTDALLLAVEKVLAGAPALLQYRGKSPDAALRREQAQAVAARCRAAGVPLVVNDDLGLALAVGAEGVHLGRDDGDIAAARAALGPQRLLGVSCYDEWALAQAGASAGADYVAFGAMYPSPTKPQAVRAPLELLGRARRELGVMVVAIGGITLERAPALVEAGADLLAVITDVFDAADPAARAGAYRQLYVPG